MKTIKLRDLDNPPIKVKLDDRKYPDHLMRPHFLMGIVASRGGGKTTALLNMIRRYDEAGTFDKLYFFCPTIKNDPKYAQLTHGDHTYEPHIYEDFTKDGFSNVLDEIDADLEEYADYKDKLRLYRKFLRTSDPNKLSPDELLDLEAMGFEEPTCKFGRKPFSLMVFDDMAGVREVYSPTGIVSKFAIKHRHKCVSLIYIQQLYQNGIPRQIRSNLSCLMLFANKNDNIRKQIAQEFAGFVDAETFMKFWDFACREHYDFLLCDFDAKDKNHRFRRNFDELLVVDDPK